jgi:hypothetical protein
VLFGHREVVMMRGARRTGMALLERSGRPAACAAGISASRAFLPNLLVFPSSGRARIWHGYAWRRAASGRRGG